jgi:cell division protein FtsA
MKEDFYTGLDIGSHSIKVAVAQEVGETLQIIGCAEVPAAGVSRGSIVSIEDTVSSLSAALEAVERMTGRPITRAAVGISGTHISTQESRGVIAVSRADGEVKDDDVDRVVEAAQAVATPPNHDILHVIPIQFTVDNQTAIKDPIGMSGVRLEVIIQMVQALTGEVKNFTKTVYRTGLEIDDLVLGVLACSESVLTRRQKELGTALINIGASTTSIAVFEEGDMLHASVIPIGSAHVTSDLAIGLRTSIETAERVKLGVGRVGTKKINKRDIIDLSKFSADEKENASLLEIHKIIEARLEEIFDHANQRLSLVGRAGRLPAGVVLTGGGSKLPGIVEQAKENFRLPASLGLPINITSSIEKAQDMTFTTASGLVLWDFEWRAGSSGLKSMTSPKELVNMLGSLGSRFKKLIR